MRYEITQLRTVVVSADSLVMAKMLYTAGKYDVDNEDDEVLPVDEVRLVNEDENDGLDDENVTDEWHALPDEAHELAEML